ncbi:MFS transporter [Alicyclobacillus macrosporangiidus]|uniref:MFS transporter n=1 Tax=Alicyclobacillus macrosporangiidus TaxID=392015 RepID=UPI0034E93EFA
MQVTYIQQGTPEFRKASFGLFIGAWVTFTILYCIQPLLPAFSQHFQVSPAVSSLSLSVTTAALAIGMLFMASLSHRYGPKRMMTFSLLASAVLVLISAWVQDFASLLVVRTLQGIALAGLPSIAMGYLGEEVEPKSLGYAMGLYIAGNTVGGMSGRIITGMISDWLSWRWALGFLGALGVVLGMVFWWILPVARNFQPRRVNAPVRLRLRRALGVYTGHLRDPGLLCLFGIAFLLMGGQVALYNYIGYQLMAPPYRLSQTAVGWLFVVYTVGTFSSAWMGRVADRHGRQLTLWIGTITMALGAVITVPTSLVWKVLGLAVFTFGFFASHSTASGWVGWRAAGNKAEASSLYLLFYYMGSSVGGFVGGLFWSAFAWRGVIAMIVGFTVLAMGLQMRLSQLTRTVTAANSRGGTV